MKTRDTKNSTLHKAKILALLNEKGAMTKTQLAQVLKVSRPTIYHHIEVLKKRNLVKESQPNLKKKGSPIFLSITSKADPLSLKSLEMIEKGLEKVKDLVGK